MNLNAVIVYLLAYLSRLDDNCTIPGLRKPLGLSLTRSIQPCVQAEMPSPEIFPLWAIGINFQGKSIGILSQVVAPQNTEYPDSARRTGGHLSGGGSNLQPGPATKIFLARDHTSNYDSALLEGTEIAGPVAQLSVGDSRADSLPDALLREPALYRRQKQVNKTIMPSRGSGFHNGRTVCR